MPKEKKRKDIYFECLLDVITRNSKWEERRFFAKLIKESQVDWGFFYFWKRSSEESGGKEKVRWIIKTLITANVCDKASSLKDGEYLFLVCEEQQVLSIKRAGYPGYINALLDHTGFRKETDAQAFANALIRNASRVGIFKVSRQDLDGVEVKIKETGDLLGYRWFFQRPSEPSNSRLINNSRRKAPKRITIRS